MNFCTRISLCFLLPLLASACKVEPDLFLRETVQAQIVMETRVNVNVMWQVNWDTEWKFRWNVETLGPLGYEEPSGMRVHTYALDAQGMHKDHTVRNFIGNYAEIPVFMGTYDMLFHNNDSEVLLFRQEDELGDVNCTTRIISSGLKDSDMVYTSKQKAAGTRTDGILPDEPVALMPDPLFTLYDQGHVITDDLSQYELVDGRYVIRINGELHPATYIYLFQINLINNDGRVIGSNGGAAVTGLSSGVDMNTGITDVSTVSVPIEVYFDREHDMMGGRLVTFGIPGCYAYDKASVAAAPDGRHYFVLNVSYANGTWRNIRLDVTAAMRDLPLGGVIDLEVDVNDFPPQQDPGPGGSGGGFNALIGSWEDVQGGTTIQY